MRKRGETIDPVGAPPRVRLVALLLCALATCLPALAQERSAPPVARITLSGARSLTFEYTFPSPADPSATSAPDGLDRFSLAGINLSGFSRELALNATALRVDVVEAVELPADGVELGTAADVPLSGDSAADARARAALPKLAIQSVYPAAWAEARYIGRIGESPISSLLIHPYRYDPRRNVLLWARRIVVTVQTADAVDPIAAIDLTTTLAPRRGEIKSSSALMAGGAKTVTTAPDGFEYKLITDADGVYRASARDLAALGVPIDRIDVRTMKLYHDGVEVPIYISDRSNNRLEVDSVVEEYIEFFGERKRAENVPAGSDLYYDLYTRHGTYFLTWDGEPGKRIVEEAGDIKIRDVGGITSLTERLASFQSRLHLEENTTQADLGNVELNTYSDRFDHGMWGKVEPTAQKAFEIDVPTPAIASNDPVRLTIALRGASGSYREQSEVLNRGYTVGAYLGAPKVISGGFRGDAIAWLSSDTNGAGTPTRSPLASFVGGKGTIVVTNEGTQTGSRGGYFFVNWFELTYPRLYQGYNDTLGFTVPPGSRPGYYLFRLRGFRDPNIRVYRTGVSRITNLSIIRVEGSGGADSVAYDAQFQAYAASDRELFHAVSESRIARPLMLKDSSANLRSADNDYNFVVVVDEITSDLAELDKPDHALNQFVLFKETHGDFKVRIVRATDIYDEFNYGSVSPLALQRFFGWAYHNWKRPLKYALIFGNGTEVEPQVVKNVPVEQQSYMLERAWVPTILFQTVDWGPTPCDYLLGCVDGLAGIQQNLYEMPQLRTVVDFFPEVHVGRVNTTEIGHVRAYVHKLIAQETAQDPGEWRSRAGFIAGGEQAFTTQIDKFVREQFRFVSEPHRIYTSAQFAGTAYANSDRIFPLMNDLHIGMLAYLGHGGGSQWEDVARLNTQAVADLDNANHMPTVLSFTCFTGAYRADKGLLSALLIQERVGAIQAFGTAAFGWLENNGWLAESIFSVLNNPRYRHLSFGEIVALGKAKYMGNRQLNDQGQVPTLTAMYSIFGDPSLKVPVPRDTVMMHPVSGIAAAGARVEASVTFPFTPTNIAASLFDTTETAIERFGVPAGRTVTVAATVPGGYAQDFVGLRVYAWDEQGNSAIGSVRWATSARSWAVVRPTDTIRVAGPAVFEIDLAGGGLTEVIVVVRYSNGQVTLDSQRVRVTSIGNGRYRTDPIDGSLFLPGAIVDVIVPLTGGGSRQTSYTYYAEGGADPAAYAPTPLDSTRDLHGPHPQLVESAVPNPTIGINSSPTGTELTATIYNWGDRAATGVPYELWIRPPSASGSKVVLGNGTVDIPARSSATVRLDIGPQLPIEQKVYLTLAPDQRDRWSDAYDGNNQTTFATSLSGAAYTPALGFTPDGVTAVPFTVERIGRIDMAPGVARGAGAVIATIEPTLPPTSQPWRFLKIGDSLLPAAALRLISRLDAGSTDTARGILAFTIVRDSVSVGNDPQVVRWDPTTKLWQAFETNVDIDPFRISATVPMEGLYAVAESEDRLGPVIRFSVEGQFFSDSSIVAPDARFSAVVYDPSGVNTDLDRLLLTLDGQPLRPNVDYSLLDSTITPTTMNLRIQKEVEPGKHTLCLTAYDRLGNKREACTSFEVERDLAVRVFGNFPNPFDKVTFLAYEIRGASVVDEVELKIFNTAGKLVRTFRSPSSVQSEYLGMQEGGTGSPTALGYHEAWWDGRDNDGVEVANGVYFYRLRVRLRDEEIEKLGAMARIR